MNSEPHRYEAGSSEVQIYDEGGDISQGLGVHDSCDGARDVRTSNIKHNSKHSGIHIQGSRNYSEELSEQQHPRKSFKVAQKHRARNKIYNSYNINELGGTKCQDQVLNIDVVMMPVDVSVHVSILSPLQLF
jgi:hypothetical protein